MMEPIRVRVLLAEDNPTDALLLRQSLCESRGVQFDLTSVESLAECRAQFEKGSFDVVMVDLGLPDSSGLETFRALREEAPEVPIVVLTGLNDEDTGLQAVQLGAQDYLIKGQVQTSLLGRIIRYAVERHQLQRQLEESNQRAQHDREVRSIARLSERQGTAITSRIYAGMSLRETHPAGFRDMSERYGRRLDEAIECRIYKQEPKPDEPLRELGQELGLLRAGPRDIIEIHSNSIQKIVAAGPPARAQAYLEEGRITVLQLMGHLAAFYRNYYPQGKSEVPT